MIQNLKSVGMNPRWCRRVLAAVAVLVFEAVAGCSPHVKVGYQPPVIPLKFEIDADGQWSVSTETAVLTPVGRFSLEVAMERAPEEDALLLTLVALDSAEGDTFRVTDTSYKYVWADGKLKISTRPGKIIVTPLTETTEIWITAEDEEPDELSDPASDGDPDEANAEDEAGESETYPDEEEETYPDDETYPEESETYPDDESFDESGTAEEEPPYEEEPSTVDGEDVSSDVNPDDALTIYTTQL